MLTAADPGSKNDVYFIRNDLLCISMWLPIIIM